MTTRPYYTLCSFCAENLVWEDMMGDYSKRDVQAELDYFKGDWQSLGLAIIKTDGSMADMMAKRDALPIPARGAKLIAKRDATKGGVV